MLPTLFTIGAFSLQTFNLFVLVGVFCGGFIFWRFGRDEHYREDLLFDGYLLSFLFGLVLARLAYVVFHAGDYGWNVVAWFDIWGDPRFNLVWGVLTASWFLARYAKNQRWDNFAILDLWMPAIVTSAVLIEIGRFFAESHVGLFGLASWWASKYLFLSGLFICIAWVLRIVEYKYRMYEWYKFHGQVAQTGFVFGLGLSLLGLGLLMAQVFVDGAQLAQAQIFHYLDGASLLLIGILVILLRAGKFEFLIKKKSVTDKNSG